MKNVLIYLSPAEEDISAMMIIGLKNEKEAMCFQQHLEILSSGRDILLTGVHNDMGIELSLLDAERATEISVQAMVTDSAAFFNFIQDGSLQTRFAVAAGISRGNEAEIIADPVMASGFYVK